MTRWLCVCCVLFLPSLALAQLDQPALKPEVRTGSEVLRAVLNELKITSVRGFDDLADPGDSILISLGEPSWLRQRPAGFLRDFVRGGGAVLIATDHGLTDRLWLDELRELTNFTIVDDPVLCLDERNTFEGKPELPLLWPNVNGPILMGRNVVTSLPAHLRRIAVGNPPAGIRPLARLPDGAVYQRDPARELPQWESLFGVAGSAGAGRIVLLADAHLFINDFMARPEVDNYDFGFSVVRYLHEGKRTRCLFLEGGRTVTNFDIPLLDLSQVPWDVLMRAIPALERKLAATAERGEFDNLAWNLLRQRGVTPGRFAAYVALALTALTGVVILYRFLRARVPTEAGLPRLATSLEKHVPTVGLLPQRVEDQLKQGQLHEPARHLARSLLLGVGCTPAPTPPEVRIAGGWWHRRAVAARFARLWLLAFGVRTVPVRAHQWAGLVRDVQSLRQSFQSGEIQLESQQVA